MKSLKRVSGLLVLLIPLLGAGQITSPQINANFGVDADLRTNFYNNMNYSGNDDWFFLNNAGAGKLVIDTSGAAAITAQYVTDYNFRKLPFFRTMNYPSYSVVNNRLLIDAVFIRDYHGTDSTVFASGSNKNGMSPQNWITPVAQSIPDKNEILDMMVHVRRAGPNKTDPLWLVGGISIENTTGNRFFDFEMYQTDIFYDRASLRFYGYGPDDGHTSWTFDAAGEVVRPGDIIFTAEYSSSTLSSLEARIWVHRDALNMTPAGFIWSGSFDGASNGSTYGYAGIKPNTTGAFYTGLANGNNQWAGPFQLVLGDNSIATHYTARQFMEFSVNLTKLGLDPVTLLGGDDCGMPFRRVLVKTRASTSFTAELKDFVGPFDFFLAPMVQAAADVPVFCNSVGYSEIIVTNPSPTSDYTWTTEDGNIVSSPTGPSIYVDSPGTYIVTQRLQAGCSVYAMDTVTIVSDAQCSILGKDLQGFAGILKESVAHISWETNTNENIQYFEIEKSIDGKNFTSITTIPAGTDIAEINKYLYKDDLNNFILPAAYYRLKIKGAAGQTVYTNIVRIANPQADDGSLNILPNPVRHESTLHYTSALNRSAWIRVLDYSGRQVMMERIQLRKGSNLVNLKQTAVIPDGAYMIQLMNDDQTVLASGKFIKQKIK